MFAFGKYRRNEYCYCGFCSRDQIPWPIEQRKHKVDYLLAKLFGLPMRAESNL